MSDTNKQFYIYQHVPKCAGQSFREVCRGLGLDLILEKPPGKANKELWEEFKESKVDLASMPTDTMICGHLIHDGIRPRERYADEIAQGNVRIVTLLRDPMERAISAYFYRQRQGKKVVPTVEDHLANMKNPMAHHLGFFGFEGTMRKFLETFFFVAVAENYDGSVRVLAKLMEREPVEVPRINATPRKPYEVSDAAREAFRKQNELDYAMFAEGKTLLEERHRELFGEGL
ncbi:MAG: hypothetical protein WA771_09360 [Chthoniobacterales bacterium]